MSPEQLILPRLQRLRRTGPDRGIASCPTANHIHGDRHPSLTWRVLPDGRLLLKCWSGGCSIHEITTALGLEVHHLFPERMEAPGPDHPHRERRPISAEDALRVLDFEAALILLAAQDLAHGRTPTPTDLDRLHVAYDRINEARHYALDR